MHKILRISLSAALVSARLAGTAEAAYLPEDFDQIEAYVEAGNWVGLRTYLVDNPRILDCDDALAGELRRFLNEASGLYAALVFEPDLFPNTDLRNQTPASCLPGDAPDAVVAGRERARAPAAPPQTSPAPAANVPANSSDDGESVAQNTSGVSRSNSAPPASIY